MLHSAALEGTYTHGYAVKEIGHALNVSEKAIFLMSVHKSLLRVKGPKQVVIT